MSKHNDGGPAFPSMYADCAPDGMSLRDYFAGQALMAHGAIVAAQIDEMANLATIPGLADDIARACYALADAMLKARERA